METKVKEFFPETRHGFLENPDGGKDILFRKEWVDRGSTKEPFPIPTKGDAVEVLKLDDRGKGPRATKWKFS